MEILWAGVDPARLTDYLDRLAAIGGQPAGGVTRLVYTPEWQSAQDRVARWLAEAGLAVRRDAAGNLFGRLEGERADEVVLTGSHLDTVVDGGRFDGPLGIVSALEAVRLLAERFGRPRRTVEVVATCEEEGSRFPAGIWGSRAMVGNIAPSDLETIHDGHGIAIGEAMRACGLDPNRLGEARRRDLVAFVELHVEQGPQLEREQADVGIVSRIGATQRFSITLRGRADHAGTMPMPYRRDALVGAAEAIVELARRAEGLGGSAVATVGWLQVYPGQRNVVPGEVRFSIDARDAGDEPIDRLVRELETALADVAGRRHLELVVERSPRSSARAFDRKLVDLMQQSADELGLRSLLLVGCANHDAKVLAAICPAGMIFVPSREGRSHSPLEYTAPEQAAAGVRLLAATLYRLAYGG